jgi:type IV pilus assembly protein PilO
MGAKGRIALGVIIVVIILGLNHWQYYQPKSEQLESWKAQNQRVSAELNELQKVAAEIPQKQAELARLKEELAQAQAILPEKKEIPALLASVSSLGREARLEFLTFKPLKETLRDFYAEVPVEISVCGRLFLSDKQTSSYREYLPDKHEKLG